MNIRKATPNDLDAIEKIYNEIHTAEETGAAKLKVLAERERKTVVKTSEHLS